MAYTIIEDEIVRWLESYEGERFHAVLADPPYALISISKRFGKEGSAPAQEGTDGRYSRLSGGFMGQRWDGFENLAAYRTWIKKWGKLLSKRVLYPGAVCLFFGGTRTWHHLALGLEEAGFDVYDTIMWLYGQGFPKRHTALKPAWEPILLCRTPREGQTFDSLALEHGSGALNIDGARIPGSWKWGTQTDIRGGRYGGCQARPSDGDIFAKDVESHHQGRWPANLMLTHHEDCQKVGTYEVPARVINRWLDGMKPFGDGAGGEYETIHPSRQGEPSTERTYEEEGSIDFAMKPGARRDKDMEIIERWACVSECPVRQLDDQVGILKTGDRTGKRNKPKTKHTFGNFEMKDEMPSSGDTGGPSRFFYCGKASRSEKDKGLEEFYWERADRGFKRIDRDRYEQLPRRERASGNVHPTVKPLDLLRYLATLLLPPEANDRQRRILVPFSGSGSEVIACVQAGWDEVIGVELEPNYNEIAHARLRANIGMF